MCLYEITLFYVSVFSILSASLHVYALSEKQIGGRIYCLLSQ